MLQEQPKTRKKYAELEYLRLTKLYREAGADAVKLAINDSLIRKVAEVFGILEAMKDIPTLYYDPRHPGSQKETAAGKARVKYMAQYVSAMQKLNKEMLGEANDDDGDLGDYE